MSTARKYFLLTAFCVLLSSACWSSVGRNDKAATAETEIVGDFPFVIKEPAVYQAHLSVSGDGVSKRWFVARDGERWRIDFLENNVPSRSRLRSDAVYSIDHNRKVYTEAEAGGDTVTGLVDQFFKGNEYRKFEKLGSENNVARYRVQGDPDQGPILISVDEITGMILRQEIMPQSGTGIPLMVFELSNFTTTVDGGTFAIPSDYRKVSRTDYRRSDK